MNTFIQKILIALATCLPLASNVAYGLSYQDAHLIIIYINSKQVAFDLGGITNYTGLSSGTQVTVTNWSLSVVTNSIGPIKYAKFALLATSAYDSPAPSIWVTDGVTNHIPTNLYAPRFQAAWTRINSYGMAISDLSTDNYFAYTSSSGNVPSNFIYAMGIYAGPMFYYSQLGGNLEFPVVNTIPGSSAFYRLDAVQDPLTSATKIGAFQIDTNGILTFTAGN